MSDFDLIDFTPYLLTMAAGNASAGFQLYYKEKYGMLRTEWRVLFHLGRYGSLTAKQICTRGQLHKTEVSRAVAALETKRFLIRAEMDEDRRQEILTPTANGLKAFNDLSEEAGRYDTWLTADFTPEERAVLSKCLRQLAAR